MIIAEAQPVGKIRFPSVIESSAVGAASQELETEVARDLEKTVSGSVFWAATVLRAKAQSRLFELAQIGSNWDTYGAPAPNEAALENAVRVLEHMKPFDLMLASIVPSAEGGVGFCFSRDDRYADIESSNDGDIIGVRYIGKQPPVLIETDGTDDSIEAALQQVRNHISA
jgi:hypothetical protein